MRQEIHINRHTHTPNDALTGIMTYNILVNKLSFVNKPMTVTGDIYK